MATIQEIKDRTKGKYKKGYTYTDEQRRKMVEMYLQGAERKEVCEALDIHPSAVYDCRRSKWWKELVIELGG